MVRRHVRTTEKAKWTSEQLKAAITAIQNGRAIREVAKSFGIPRSTIQKRMKTNNTGAPSMGRHSVFDGEQEKTLADHAIYLSKLFYGISRNEIKNCAYHFAERNNMKCPFNSIKKSAGDDWLQGFLKRNPQVSLRKPEATSINRLTAFNKTEVNLFFQNLDELMTKFKFKQARIFNTDETGISTVQKPQRVLAQKGLKQVGFATSWERGKNITVVCAFSAAGVYVPPMFIFARERMSPLLARGGPPGSLYTCSKKGWITEELFLQYLKHFQQFVKASKEDPVLLVMDNHSTHCTLAAYNFCKNNGIELLTIPPHSSHRIQPLDVTFYSSLKSAFNGECCKYLKNHPHEKITPFQISEIFNNAYMRTATPEKAIKGFEKTGICPYNPDVFTDEDFLAAELHNSNNDLRNASQDISTAVRPAAELEINNDSQNENLNVSFVDILPIPQIPSTSGVIKKRKVSKQHSQIMTATPNKDILEEKENKKKVKQDKTKKSYKRKIFDADDDVNFQIPEKRGSRHVKPTTFKQNTSSDEDNDDDVKDKSVGADICLVCGEFGKNGELWIRCVTCQNWAHKACTNFQKGIYICDYCS